MSDKKNEIDSLIDELISNGDDLVNNIKTKLPASLSESISLFQETNVTNLKKIKEFLNQ